MDYIHLRLKCVTSLILDQTFISSDINPRIYVNAHIDKKASIIE